MNDAKTNHRISNDKEWDVEFKPGKKEIVPRGNKRPENSNRVEFKLGEKEIASRIRGNKRSEQQ